MSDHEHRSDSQEQTGGQPVDYERLMAEAQQPESDSREAFAARLEPSIETQQFKDEMEAPRQIEDAATGISYAVYQLNQGKEGTPLVVNLAWSVSAESGVGRADLNEFVNHIDRPVVAIDMEATGKTGIPEPAQRKAATFQSIAASHLRVVDQLGIDEFDVAGYSLGGDVAVGMAAQAGDRVKHLVTIAAPGFEDTHLLKLGMGFGYNEPKHTKAYREDAAVNRPTILGQDAAAQAATSGTINAKNIVPLLKFAKLMTGDETANAIGHLSPDTKWTDVIGSKDAVTNWTGHLEAVRARNARYPHSSTEHVLGSETHSMGIHRPAMAEVVAQSLKK